MDKHIITTSNITKILRGKKVLDNISLNFERGKIYGIVGPNASGKTMLFRAISGLIRLDSGVINYAPQNLSLGVVIENPGFLLSYSGIDNLKFLASIKNQITETDIMQSMRMVGLDPYDRRKVKAYSLGMKQKLAIAQAIMEKPDVLILDEPTRGLDEESVNHIRALLTDINKDGTTILIASHNKEDILFLCNEVVYMNEGKATRACDKS